MLILRKAFSFIKRDFINETSYKFAFVLQIFGILLPLLAFFFLSRMFEGSSIPSLEPYGGNYFAFILIGFAFSDYLRVSLGSLSSSIRKAQVEGTLETLLVTQTSIPTIILSSSLYSFIWTSFRVILYLLLGAFVFGVDMGGANIPAAILILILTILSFSSIGILSASFIMVLKRGDPLTWGFTSASWLLGGVFFPTSVLPYFLRIFSYLLPITYSLEGMRMALLKGYSFEMLAPNILGLMIFSIIVLPLSVLTFRYAVKKAKIDGTLTQY